MKTEKKIIPKIRLCDYEGNLSKRWFIYWRENGYRIKKYKGINRHHSIKDRKEAARNLIAEWKEKLDQNITGFKGTKYANQYEKISKFIDSKRATWRTSTERQVDSRIRIFLEWNNRKLISKERIEEFLNYLYSIGRKQNTVSGYYLILRNVIGNALGKDIFEGLYVKKGGGVTARYFSKGQIKFLSKTLSKEDPELWLAVQFIFYCFIRPNELRQLKVSNVIVEDARICIPAHISKNKKTQYIIIPEAF